MQARWIIAALMMTGLCDCGSSQDVQTSRVETHALAANSASTGGARLEITRTETHQGQSLTQHLALSKVRIQAPYGTARRTVAYMQLENRGPEADRLTSVSVDQAEQASLHTMAMKGDVMEMTPMADGLNLAAGAQAELKPGGDHLMIEGLKTPLKAGDHLRLTLHFEKAGNVSVDAPVVMAAPGQ